MDNQIIDFQTRLFQCRSFDESWQLYLGEMEQCGFAHLSYGHTVFDDNEVHPQNICYYLTSYRQEFVDDYMQVDGVENDISITYALYYEQPLEWALEEKILLEGKSIELSSAQRVVDDVSKDHGIVHGYTIPLKLPGGNVGGAGLSATGIQKKEFEQDIAPNIGYITVITNLFHIQALQFPRPLRNAVVGKEREPLTVKEREVIKWLAHGYKIQLIAEKKMFRSQESVNLYIRKAKDKLKALNVAQLVAKAMVLRLI